MKKHIDTWYKVDRPAHPLRMIFLYIDTIWYNNIEHIDYKDPLFMYT